jgi:hypothetical protein
LTVAPGAGKVSYFSLFAVPWYWYFLFLCRLSTKKLTAEFLGRLEIEKKKNRALPVQCSIILYEQVKPGLRAGLCRYIIKHEGAYCTVLITLVAY